MRLTAREQSLVREYRTLAEDESDQDLVDQSIAALQRARDRRARQAAQQARTAASRHDEDEQEVK